MKFLRPTSFRIASDHPSLAGHFPGNPVVPGVLILEEVILAIKSQLPACQVRQVDKLKFILPLKIGRKVVIEFVVKAGDIVQFACRQEDVLLVSGQIGL